MIKNKELLINQAKRNKTLLIKISKVIKRVYLIN